MHFGTFIGAEEEGVEACVLLVEAGEAEGKGKVNVGKGKWVEEGGFGWVDVGAGGVVRVGG
jgi:hypothetical protein